MRDRLANLAMSAALASYDDHRTPEINVTLTSALRREDCVNGDPFVPFLIHVCHMGVIGGHSGASR
jgi:hypothetical protein